MFRILSDELRKHSRMISREEAWVNIHTIQPEAKNRDMEGLSRKSEGDACPSRVAGMDVLKSTADCVSTGNRAVCPVACGPGVARPCSIPSNYDANGDEEAKDPRHDIQDVREA